MTEAEFHAALEPLLTRHPFVPIRVDGEVGPLATVSNPYRADLFEGTLTVLHKDEGRRPVAVVKAEQVTRIIPYDDLPAEPGCLSYREFHQTFRSLFWATPFRPFAVELIDGRQLVSETQGQILVNGRFAAYSAPHGRSVTFPIADVAGMTVLQPAEAA